MAPDYSWNFDVAHENDANPESILEIQFLGDVNNTGFNPGTATSGLAFDSRGLMLPGAGVGYEGVANNWLYNEFVKSIDKDGCTDIRMFSTLMFRLLEPEQTYSFTCSVVSLCLFSHIRVLAQSYL